MSVFQRLAHDTTREIVKWKPELSKSVWIHRLYRCACICNSLCLTLNEQDTYMRMRVCKSKTCGNLTFRCWIYKSTTNSTGSSEHSPFNFKPQNNQLHTQGMNIYRPIRCCIIIIVLMLLQQNIQCNLWIRKGSTSKKLSIFFHCENYMITFYWLLLLLLSPDKEEFECKQNTPNWSGQISILYHWIFLKVLMQKKPKTNGKMWIFWLDIYTAK